MAGEWLKMECCTPDKPEVFAITTKMGWDDPDLTVGKLFRVWRWFDQHTTEGNAHGVSLALLDRIVCVSGFAKAMVDVGWLLVGSEGLNLPNFGHHNGTTAKKRSQTAKRVANHAANQSPNANPNAETNAASVSDALAREEKKREEKNKVKSTVGQDQPDQSIADTVVQIFEFWQKVMDSPKSKLDKDRKTLIVNALKNYSPADICKAIRGCSKTPHNMGKNDRNTLFNGLNLILRNAEKIDYFIKLDGVQARPGGTETIAEANARIMRELLGPDQGANVIDGEMRTIETEASP
jgi:hypothetical protein